MALASLKHTCRAVTAGAALVLSISTAQALPAYSDIYIFGDSLSDTGNTRTVVGAGSGLIANLAGYGSNARFSNGPVWHEYLAADLGITTSNSLSGGTNYAYGGARIDNATGASTGVLNQYEQYKAGPGTGGADSNALYIAWAGGNDMRDLVGSGNPQPTIDSIIGNFRNVLSDLLFGGAMTIIVPNLPNLGAIPEFAPTANAGSATFVTESWNAALDNMVSGLANDYRDATIVQLDIFGFFTETLANPEAFGFTNTTGTCRSLGFLALTEISCANADEYVFWDDIHPTTAAHQMIGQLALDSLVAARVSEPRTVFMLVVGLFLMLVMVRRQANTSTERVQNAV